jgi:hypothetical protein
VDRLNNFLRGWSNYFDTGYPKKAFVVLNFYVERRMWQLLKHLSHRSFKPPEGMSWYKFVYAKVKVDQMKAKARVQAFK